MSKSGYIKEENKIKLGKNGAGRDRNVGMKAMIDNMDTISQKCKEEFKDCDMVFVAASCGGGTGSGGLPIAIEILLDSFENVGAIIGLPEDSESPKAKMNTLECFEQLSSFDDIGCVFIIDNQKAQNVNGLMPRNKLYEVTNKQIIDYLCAINDLTDRPSYVSNFDANDLLGILQERGYAFVDRVETKLEKGDNKFKIAKLIRESWKTNYQPALMNGQIVKAAILSKIDPEFSCNIDMGIVFQEIGIPYDFNDVCFIPENKKDENRGYIFYSILSGLAFPQERLSAIDSSIKNVEEKLITNINASHNQTFVAGNLTSKFKKEKKEKNKKCSLLDKVKKYMPK